MNILGFLLKEGMVVVIVLCRGGLYSSPLENLVLSEYGIFSESGTFTE